LRGRNRWLVCATPRNREKGFRFIRNRCRRSGSNRRRWRSRCNPFRNCEERFCEIQRNFSTKKDAICGLCFLYKYIHTVSTEFRARNRQCRVLLKHIPMTEIFAHSSRDITMIEFSIKRLKNNVCGNRREFSHTIHMNLLTLKPSKDARGKIDCFLITRMRRINCKNKSLIILNNFDEKGFDRLR
jgi:hypothetical protein